MRRNRFDLTLSENPFPPLPSVLDALNDTLTRSNRYPEFLPQRLPELIAGQLGVRPEQVVVGSGATGVALQTMQALTAPGGRMAFALPTFDGYPIMAKMAGLEAVTVPLDSSGRQNLWELARAVDDRTALVAVCRPHNPTGTVVPASELKAFLFGIPRHVPVILDEAYVEFLGAGDVLDAVELIARYPNLLVLRTFSKAYGLAGLRIGYAFGDSELVHRVRRLQLPFGMPETAVTAVAACYAAADELHERVLRITTERELLRTALRRSGIRVPRSHANFLYLPGPSASGPKAVAERHHAGPADGPDQHSPSPAAALARAGIAAKVYPDGSARVAVGDPTSDAAVLDALCRPTAAAIYRPFRRDDTGLWTQTVRADSSLSRRHA